MARLARNAKSLACPGADHGSRRPCWRAFGGGFPERPTCVGVDHGISNEW